MEALNIKNPGGTSTDPVTQAKLAELQKQQNALQDKIEAEMKLWARNTSIVLVLFATLVMGISLMLSEQLRVISNGLLLGGLFTMLYGAGWVIFSGNSVARFAVILFALVVALGLGYLKFVRGREARIPAAPAAPFASGQVIDDAALAGLAERVSALEDRAAAAAAALGGEERSSHATRRGVLKGSWSVRPVESKLTHFGARHAIVSAWVRRGPVCGVNSATAGIASHCLLPCGAGERVSNG